MSGEVHCVIPSHRSVEVMTVMVEVMVEVMTLVAPGDDPAK